MRKLVLGILSGVAILFFVCTPALAQTTGTIRGQINNRGGSGKQQAYFGLPRSLNCVLAAP